MDFVYPSPALRAMSLPILTCSYCMRKVGLWNFHQMEGTGGDGEALPTTASPSDSAAGPASTATHESQGEQAASASSTPATTPCRMKLRSQDSVHTDQASFKQMKVDQHKLHLIKIIYNNVLLLQGEGTSSPVALRARSRDSPSPSEELPSPLTRGKRTAARRGQGDNSGTDAAATMHHPPKRLCLSSHGGPVRTNVIVKFTVCLCSFIMVQDSMCIILKKELMLPWHETCCEWFWSRLSDKCELVAQTVSQDSRFTRLD